MKKLAKMILSFTLISLLVIPAASAVYTGGPVNSFFNRTNAQNYIYNYTITPNPAYYDYTGYGGDCTNFVSQVLYAGGMPMTASV